MLLRQLEYFCAVVEQSSFTRAADNCLVSQSAVSQAVHALESELGVELLQREGRSFRVKPTGELVARRGRAVLSSVDEMEREVRDLELGLPTQLRIGSLAPYRGDEMGRCLASFAKSHPRVTLDVVLGSHEFLNEELQRGRLDVALSDQRRALAPGYEYAYLGQSRYWIEVSEVSPYAWALELSPMQLTDVPIILVARSRQREAERDYCANVLGFRSEFLFVPSLQEGRLLVAANRGLLVNQARERRDGEVGISRQVPLVDDAGQITRDLYCLWPQRRANAFLEEFGETLREQFGLSDEQPAIA